MSSAHFLISCARTWGTVRTTISIKRLALALIISFVGSSTAIASPTSTLSTNDALHSAFVASPNTRYQRREVQVRPMVHRVFDSESTVGLLDDQTNDNSNNVLKDLFVFSLKEVIKYYINHSGEVNKRIEDALKPQPDPDLRGWQNLLNNTPYLSVLSDASPCAGPDTLRVLYHKDRSSDCVNVMKSAIAQSGGSILLFIGAVDTLGRTNNALVYELRPETNTAEFIGTVTYVGHSGFRLDIYPGKAIEASYDNSNGTRTLCEIAWVNGKYHEACGISR
jgi:hypothetical protein